jgi:hypothetical protein
MALDYRKHNHDDNFETKLAERNPWFPTGKTGYEQYYTDLEGFWRQLYNYPVNSIYANKFEKNDYFQMISET